MTATWAHAGLSGPVGRGVYSVGRLVLLAGFLFCARRPMKRSTAVTRRWRREGVGVDGGGVDAGEDLTGGVEVACTGVAFGEPGLVEGDFAGVVVVVGGECSDEEGFGGGGVPSSMRQRAAMTSISPP